MTTIVSLGEESPPRWLTSLVVAPNLVSLDAPAVAVSWQWLISSHFGIDSIPATRVLFATVWLIYVADRLLDARRLDTSGYVSRRHRFAARWAAVLWPVCGVIFVATCSLALLTLPRMTLAAGCGLTVIVAVYAWVIHCTEVLHKRIPKEFAVGICFAIGTCLPAMCHQISLALVVTVALLSLLFTLNCLCVSLAQRECDRSQGSASAILLLPWLGRRLPALAAGNMVLAAIAVWAGSLPMSIAMSIALSGAGLVAVACMIDRGESHRTDGPYGYLADYLLLSPVLMMGILGSRLQN